MNGLFSFYCGFPRADDRDVLEAPGHEMGDVATNLGLGKTSLKVDHFLASRSDRSNHLLSLQLSRRDFVQLLLALDNVR